MKGAKTQHREHTRSKHYEHPGLGVAIAAEGRRDDALDFIDRHGAHAAPAPRG